MKNFAEWTKQPIYSFPEWVRSTISYEIRLRQEKLALGIIKNKKRVNNLQQDIPKLTKILENKNLFQAFIKENHLIFKKQYEKYKKGCYKDEKYTRYENRGNFTAFTQQCLPLMLIDLYKRKELLKRNKIPLEEVINIGEKPDLDSNIFAKEIIKNLKSLLTPAENRVFKYKLDEWTNVDIAKRLKISKGRISQLVKNIRQKAKKLNFF